eukprot:gene25962-32476_t
MPPGCPFGQKSAGARGGTRTRTVLPPSGPKPGASTNFATRAGPNKKGEQAGMGAIHRPDRPLEIAARAASVGRGTRNQAAYMAGSASKVRAVATIKPPMMATAIGPQNTLRESGIMASTAAA